MTMPIERMRALRWGAEVLEELTRDEGLGPDTRLRAAEILAVYPDVKELARWVAEAKAGLPQGWVQAVVDAGEFFRTVSVSGRGSGQSRQALRFTLRHFPDEETIRLIGLSPRISEWLVVEDAGEKELWGTRAL